MRCPTLSELPPPPAGLTGWPWTEGSTVLPAEGPDGREWPLVSVVTPSFNQARYLEARGFGGTAPAAVPVEVLRDFHDGIASSGSLPLGLARRAVLGPVGAA